MPRGIAEINNLLAHVRIAFAPGMARLIAWHGKMVWMVMLPAANIGAT